MQRGCMCVLLCPLYDESGSRLLVRCALGALTSVQMVPLRGASSVFHCIPCLFHAQIGCEPRMRSSGDYHMFYRFGLLAVRWRYWIIGLWAFVALASLPFAPRV